jgi:prolyl oligopeptidase
MHAFDWNRQRAIDFMMENTGKTENDIIVEIDRYIVWPGQALAYKIGELKIKELRTKSEKELADNFDIRKFHNALLDNGPVPLDVLENLMLKWIDQQKVTSTN